MLVIARKCGQSFTVETPTGEVIEVHLRSLRNGVASLAIGAPRDHRILRNEIAKDLLRGRVASKAKAADDAPARK